MTDAVQKLLKWCRYARIDDTRDDGVCSFALKFKIRGEDMRTVFSSISYLDACGIARCILNSVCPGCEDFDEDWKDPDNNAFVMDVWLEDGFIVMGGNYRT